MRPLTKSRFRLALECPRKLIYAGNPAYADRRADDEYLRALAQGGFQVGALAKLHHPGGVEVSTLNADEAVAQTNALLAQENVTIFEAAFRYEALLVRADIVVKRGSLVELVEVKSASWPPAKRTQLEEPFFYVNSLKKENVRVKDLRKFGAHLFDVAFQTYVARKAHPGLTVLPRLCFANKDGVAEIDGIHQCFVLGRDAKGRTTVTVRAAQGAAPGPTLLKVLRVEDSVERLLSKKDFALRPDLDGGTLNFAALVKALAAGEIPSVELGSHCKRCQYRATAEELAAGKRSGFNECWAQPLAKRPQGTPVTQLWYGNTSSLVDAGRYFLEDLTVDDIDPEPETSATFTRRQRQWAQVDLLQQKATEPIVRHEALRNAIGQWQFPLHFIDFETTTVALPFHRAMRPYEQIAFQFSHHVVERDGRIAHQTQWISSERGKFPNFEFVRALREALRHDRGTILRYAGHEHNVLRAIAVQLSEQEKGAVPDRRELQEFIGDLVDESIPEIPTRGTVDMLRVLTDTYLHPKMGGSNSLKKVLPAIFTASPFLQKKYGAPIYGGGGTIPSLNFREPMTWLTPGMDPYALLEPIAPSDEPEEDLLFVGEDIANGGAAMTAYARMQFEEMSDGERQRLTAALLRYCELDTLAMVMLYEHWLEILQK